MVILQKLTYLIFRANLETGVGWEHGPGEWSLPPHQEVPGYQEYCPYSGGKYAYLQDLKKKCIQRFDIGVYQTFPTSLPTLKSAY